jgi:hypothetical protein
MKTMRGPQPKGWGPRPCRVRRHVV